MRIVIADDYPIFRDGLRRLLETNPDLQIVGEASVATAAAMVRERQPDILLLGPPLAAGPAGDTLRQLNEDGVPVRTILLIRSIDMPEVADAWQLGACGCWLAGMLLAWGILHGARKLARRGRSGPDSDQ